MEVIIQPDQSAAAKIGARIIASLLRRKPQAVLGLATGSTPITLYRELIRMHRDEGLDFSGVTTFNLDEYVGLGPDHPASYHHFMWENFLGHVNIRRSRVHIPDGMAKEVPAYCDSYERGIGEAGGIDLQVLGIGADGHIGFNEPASSLASRTRIKTLTKKTLEDNARFFGGMEAVPHHVITMGVGTIMDARQVMLLAFGESKSDAIAGAVEGPITSKNPGSVLQMHPRATILLDERAASGLQRSDYYRWVFDNKPDWQKV